MAINRPDTPLAETVFPGEGPKPKPKAKPKAKLVTASTLDRKADSLRTEWYNKSGTAGYVWDKAEKNKNLSPKMKKNIIANSKNLFESAERDLATSDRYRKLAEKARQDSAIASKKKK